MNIHTTHHIYNIVLWRKCFWKYFFLANSLVQPLVSEWILARMIWYCPTDSYQKIIGSFPADVVAILFGIPVWYVVHQPSAWICHLSNLWKDLEDPGGACLSPSYTSNKQFRLGLILTGSLPNVLEFFWYKPTTRRLVPIFYGNLRPAGAQTIWLLDFMLQMYATQQKTSLRKNNQPTKITTVVDWLPV